MDNSSILTGLLIPENLIVEPDDFVTEYPPDFPDALMYHIAVNEVPTPEQYEPGLLPVQARTTTEDI